MKYVSLLKEYMEITKEGLHNRSYVNNKLEEINGLIEAQIIQVKGN